MTHVEPLRLRQPAHLVCPRARWLWLSTAALEGLVVAAALVAWFVIVPRARGVQVPVAVGAGVVWLAYLIGMPLWRYRVHRWEVTPTAVYTQTGWLHLERRIAPLSRVQTVDLTRGPIAQALRLATVRVTTASAAGPLVIHGLDRDEAARIVETLTVAAEAEKSDAT